LLQALSNSLLKVFDVRSN